MLYDKQKSFPNSTALSKKQVLLANKSPDTSQIATEQLGASETSPKSESQESVVNEAVNILDGF